MKLKKSRGQHLLTDTGMIGKIVRSAGVGPEDNIIEIGAGTGLLTRELVEKAGGVTCFEIDEDFAPDLKELDEKHTNLQVRFEDFLDFDLTGHLEAHPQKWRVVANIPYNITSPIIRKLVSARKPNLADVHLLIQREVAERITASPGNKDYGRLSVFAQFFCNSRILFTLPPDVFTPPPQVESALLRMEFKKVVMEVNPRLYFAVVKAAFASRRKQIRNNLKNVVPGLKGEHLDRVLDRAGIDRKLRGETLTLENFKAITDQVASYLEEKGIDPAKAVGS